MKITDEQSSLLLDRSRTHMIHQMKDYQYHVELLEYMTCIHDAIVDRLDISNDNVYCHVMLNPSGYIKFTNNTHSNMNYVRGYRYSMLRKASNPEEYAKILVNKIYARIDRSIHTNRSDSNFIWALYELVTLQHNDPSILLRDTIIAVPKLNIPTLIGEYEQHHVD